MRCGNVFSFLFLRAPYSFAKCRVFTKTGSGQTSERFEGGKWFLQGATWTAPALASGVDVPSSQISLMSLGADIFWHGALLMAAPWAPELGVRQNMTVSVNAAANGSVEVREKVFFAMPFNSIVIASLPYQS